MFLQRLAAGLLFTAGTLVSRFGITQESWAILALGFSTAAASMMWLASGSTAFARDRALTA